MIDPSSPFFFYGSSVARENVDISKHFQAGLYSPIIDRFVVLHSDEKILRKVALLWSSRLDLIFVRLDSAENFTPTLIDNLVCLDWTLKTTVPFKISRFPTTRDDTIWAQTLVPVSVPLDPDDILLKNLEYIWASINWLNAYQDLMFENGINRKIDFDTRELMDFPFSIKNLEKNICQIIYSEFDFTRAKKQIDDLFQTYEFADIKKINLYISTSRS